ncbi:MAG TPA: TIGR01777 family oxidoreductase [Candidatus Limnocylindrales bacterium]|nr:TIGR01777 family oxidoreductase [Candidatus Limnocylindrales bacterium]
MKVAVTGASGLIGTRLTGALRAMDHEVIPLGRRDTIGPCDAVVHLAGEPVAQRWSARAKQEIRDSRVEGTRRLVAGIAALPQKPRVLVSSSAIGYYGSRGDETLTEESGPGSDFLATVCAAWEKEAKAAEELGIRVVRLRTGIVLDAHGGALAKMLTPFRFGLGGRLGSGRQWMSWIHIDDLAGIVVHALENPVSGAVNGVAPNPVRNSVFTQALAGTLHRPALFPVPQFGLRLMLGEMSEAVLASQRVLPKVAESSGYRFRYPDLPEALRETIIGRR